MPVFFGGKLFDSQILTQVFFAFLGFSLIASSIYIFNDLRDVEEDKIHPEKKFRAIVSGKISPQEAKNLLLVLALVAVLIFYFFFDNIWVWLCVFLYFWLNILYTVWLKKIALVDVIIISLGFIIRIFIGSAASGIYLSHWIIIMTFLLALFLAFAKRRDDVVLANSTGQKMRANMDGYNLEFLNTAIIICSAIVIVSYIMYTSSAEVIGRTGPQIYLTAFFVLVGVFRYLQIIFVKQQSGNPTKVFLKDTFLQIIMIGWLFSFGIILYFK